MWTPTSRHLRVLAFAVLPCSLACPEAPPPFVALADGGWKGTYECGADSKKMSLILDEDEAGALTGEAFLDYQVVILGTPILLTGRGDVVEGSRDDDGGYDGRIDTLDNSQGLADFDLTLAPNDDADELVGALEVKDADGAVVQSCDARLDKVNVEG